MVSLWVREHLYLSRPHNLGLRLGLGLVSVSDSVSGSATVAVTNSTQRLHSVGEAFVDELLVEVAASGEGVVDSSRTLAFLTRAEVAVLGDAVVFTNLALGFSGGFQVEGEQGAVFDDDS